MPPSPDAGDPLLFDLSLLNHWSPDRGFTTTRERIAQYAAATNDTLRGHATGDVAPPIFAVVPIWQVLTDVTEGAAAKEVRLRAVHGEQDIHFHAPILPGMDLVSRGMLLGIHVKPSGTTLVAKTETRTVDGTLLNEQFMTGFYRGVQGEKTSGVQAPSHSIETTGEPSAEVTYHFDDDQTHRYAEASGDHNLFHLDDDIARSLGLPGKIIHGLCTMAFVSRALVEATCDGDSTRLKRLALRFSNVVLPGREITTRIWDGGERGGRKTYAFDTLNPEGQTVIKDGLAEVA